MLGFALRRLAAAVPALLAIVTIAFFLVRFAPGGPFDLAQPLSPAVLDNIRKVYRLDQPLFVQYLDYLGRLARGDLGPSYVYRDFTVQQLIADGLPYSLQLGGMALLLALGIGIGAGTLAALHQNRAEDYAVMTVATVGVTVPNFIVAPILTLIFAVWLGWLPAGGWGPGWTHKILPVLVLALPQAAVIARLTRAGLLEALRADHVRTARALGLPSSTVVLRALRGALLPVVSYLGPAAAGLLTGSVVVETIFGIPGVGRYFVQGALNRDYTLVMGTVVLIAVFVLVFNLLVDLLYAVLDPKVRHG
jgi:oligopeptide transport system permease protein